MGRARENLYGAVDVGTSQTRVLVARVTPLGGLDVVAGGISPSRGIQKGMVVNLADTQESIVAAVDDARRGLGRPLPPAWVSISGSHLRCHNAIGAAEMESFEEPISHQDLEEVVLSSVPQPVPERQVVQVIPQVYVVDGLRSSRKPVGVCGRRLHVESHVVLADAVPLGNITNAVRRAGLQVQALVLGSLSSGEAVLTGHEREVGVMLVDIGGGTSDLALFRQGTIWHTAVVPVGGYQFTNDLCLALAIPFPTAESLKLRHGHAMLDAIEAGQPVEFPEPERMGNRRVLRRDLCRRINERATELVRLLLHRARKAGLSRLPAGGVVLTGGTAKLPGLVDLMREITGAPVRLGLPLDSLGLPEGMVDPSFATSVGTILWGIRHKDGYIPHSGQLREPSWLRRWTRWFPHHIPAQASSVA